MKCAIIMKPISMIFLLLLTLFWSSSAWAWGWTDQLYLIQESFTFDGFGAYTQTLNEYEFNRTLADGPMTNIGGPDPNADYALPNQYSLVYAVTSETGDSDTYTVDEDGDLSINYEDGPMIGAVSSDGDVLILSEADCDLTNHYCSMGLGLGVKFDSTISGESLSGNYTVYEFETGFYGQDDTHFSGETAWGTTDQQYLMKTDFTFSGGSAGGTYTENLDEYQHNRQIMDGPMTNIGDDDPDADYALPNQHTTECSAIFGETGGNTYSIANGVVTITYDDGPMTGVLSASGNVLLLSEVDHSNNDKSCSMVLGIGVKRGSGMSAASLDGTTFTVYEFESGFNGQDVSHFSGETAWGTTDQQYIIKTEFAFEGSGETGIYTINSLTEYEQTRQLIDGPMINIGDADPDADYALPNQHTTTCSTITEPAGETGIYEVDTNGNVTLQYDDGPMPGVLSADGNVLIFSESDCDNNDKSCGMVLGVGVKKGNGMGNFSLDDNYKIYTFESGFHSPPPEPEPATVNPGTLQLLLLTGT